MNKSLEKTLQDADVSLSVLQALADNSFDSVLVTDATKAGKIIYANKSFSKLTGYTQAEVIGKTPRILQGVRQPTKKSWVASGKRLYKARNLRGKLSTIRRMGPLLLCIGE